MPVAAYRAAFIQPLVERVRDWHAQGKLGLDDLDRGLSGPARAIVEGACEASSALAEEDVESLVALVAEQLGGEAALSELAGEIASEWLVCAPIDELVRTARPLVDDAGFVAAQASEWLAVAPDWTYAGCGERFELTLRGLAGASPALKALFGGLVARLAAAGAKRALDVRVRGVDEPVLVIEARAGSSDALDPERESRLHRAALVG